MHINDCLKTFRYKITEAYKPEWGCFLNCWGIVMDETTFIVDMDSGEVVSIEYIPNDGDLIYVWVEDSRIEGFRKMVDLNKSEDDYFSNVFVIFDDILERIGFPKNGV